MAVSLQEIGAMIDLLSPTDQARLLQYLMPRLADALQAGDPNAAKTARAWQEFRQVGERLAATPRASPSHRRSAT